MPAASLAPNLPLSPQVPGRRVVDRLVAGGLIVAGTIHLVLIPQHFAENLLFGVVFSAMAAFQLGLAIALVRAPSPTVYRVALAGTLALLVTWAGTRFISPPTGTGPEEVDAWGVIVAGVELAVVVLLASSVPSLGSTPRRRGLWAAAGGLGFALIYLLASGSAGYAPPIHGYPLVKVETLTGQFSITVPALVVYLDSGRVFVTLPWSTGVFLPIASALLAAQIYLALGMTACAPRLRARRRGAISLIPAMFAAPVCCGAPLLSFLGTGAIVPLARITPLLLIATCLLLATGTWRLRRQRKRLLPATPLGRTDF